MQLRLAAWHCRQRCGGSGFTAIFSNLLQRGKAADGLRRASRWHCKSWLGQKRKGKQSQRGEGLRVVRGAPRMRSVALRRSNSQPTLATRSLPPPPSCTTEHTQKLTCPGPQSSAWLRGCGHVRKQVVVNQGMVLSGPHKIMPGHTASVQGLAEHP